MLSAMYHSLDFLNFPGGLTQSDWFGLVTGTISTGYGVTAYNQAAYTSNVAMKQAQLYQEKNYHLGWVAIARDDIREMMSISVNRIDNYNLVATLILATAADALLGVTFDPTAPNFIVHAFWTSIGLSIAYFALSVMFGIKGQNSAFTNTMKLLTWELRPENPAQYNHDYMKQAQQFERDGISQMFRLPGVWPKYQRRECGEQAKKIGKPCSHSDSVAAGAVSDDTEEGEGEGGNVLEEVVPESRRLLYLQRFANFMQLWLPLEWFSKYCIGLGLISLAQGAAYFCLGRFFNDVRLYKSTVTTALVSIFVFVTLTILRHNSRSRRLSLRVVIGIVFVWGPSTATLAMLLPHDWTKVLAPFSNFGHFFLYACLFIVSFWDRKSPQRTANKYCTGPHGQSFDTPEDAHHCSDEAARDTGTKPSRYRRSESHRGIIQDPSMPDAPSEQDLLDETKAAEMSLKDTLFTVRALVLLSAVVWFALFVVSAADYWGPASPAAFSGAQDLLDVSRVDFTWPPSTIAPHAIACSDSEVFVANRFRVFRLVNGKLTPQPCKINAAIADLALTCEGVGLCRPLVLLNESVPQVSDCAGNRFSLLQEPLPAQRYALWNSQDTVNQFNGTLLTLRGNTMIEFDWDHQLNGYSPLWERRTAGRVQNLDLKDGRLFLFRREADAITGVPMDIVQVENLRSAVSVGKWRLRSAGLSTLREEVVAGCSPDARSVYLLANDGAMYRAHTG